MKCVQCCWQGEEDENWELIPESGSVALLEKSCFRIDCSGSRENGEEEVKTASMYDSFEDFRCTEMSDC